MKIIINSKELAKKLTNESLSFDVQNKAKKEIGMEWTIEDCHEYKEWKELYSNFKTLIEQKALIK